MQITEIRMFVCDELRLKATLSLTFGEVFVVKGVKIIDGRQGMFVAMPSRKTDGGFEDICHPVTAAYREYVEDEVLRAYARETGTPYEEIQARRRRSPGPPRAAGSDEGPTSGSEHRSAGEPSPSGTEPPGDHPESLHSNDTGADPTSRPNRRPLGDSEGDGGPHPGS